MASDHLKGGKCKEPLDRSFLRGEVTPGTGVPSLSQVVCRGCGCTGAGKVTGAFKSAGVQVPAGGERWGREDSLW